MRHLLPAVFLLLSGCVNDRTFNITPTPADQQVYPGIVVINEVLAKGSLIVTEFGDSADWMELYNPGPDSVELAAGRWYVTDIPSTPFEFELPRIVLPPRGFQVVFCDSRDTVVAQIHTNFHISSNGETLALYYKSEAGPFVRIDDHTFGAQTTRVSIGRQPDGSTNWQSCSRQTPGQPNQ